MLRYTAFSKRKLPTIPRAPCRARPVRLACLLVLALAASGQVAAQIQPRPDNNTLSRLAFSSEELRPSQPVQPLDAYQGTAPSSLQEGWAAFRRGTQGEWQASVDRRTGLIASAEGAGIPWIPGKGNSLTPADVSAYTAGAGREPGMAALEAIARRELGRLAPLFGVDGKELVLNQGRSGQPAPHLWVVDFDLVRDGLVVEGARVLFRINNGNLVQFGSENLPSPGTKVPPTTLSREKARDVLSRYIGGLTSKDTLVDAGTLHLLPANSGDGRRGNNYEPGKGRKLVKVWQIIFRRQGVGGTWRARVDSATGKLIEFVDINDYASAQATGGVFLSSPAAGPEVVRAMPFADVSGTSGANSAGLYALPGGPVTSTLAGQFVQISDDCGSIAQASGATGNVEFGTSGGTDCITPGHGGAGNTHASRTQFYNVNRIKEVGRGWLPTNPWLNTQLPVHVNINNFCNANWNGTSLNFYRSGGGCANTGEIVAVSLHEYGHGLDENDGTGSSPERGTREAYGDLTAALQLHSSCMGPGFFSSNCGGYGDPCTSCSGVRDIDWAQRASNTPATVSNFTQPQCPSHPWYLGPCGREGHCESYVASQAVWDFANRDLPSPGSNAAWTVLERLWYLSRSTATNAFSCDTTGPTFTSDGCNLGSWWKTMRVIDDDDGNLANGTPHGAALFAAFNRHGIACGTDPGAGVTFAACTPPAVPSVTLAPGNNKVSVTVSGTGVFDIFRNEIGCNAGFAKIAEDFAGGTFNDSGVANGTTYFYQVVAHPSGNEACSSAPSPCASVVPALAPQIQVPSGVSVGNTCTGSTGTGTLQVCNTGQVDLVVSAITSSSPSFSVTVPSSGYPVTISPAFCFPFQVEHNPTAPGPQSAVLTIPSNDPVTPNAMVPVSGNGTEPDIRVTGSTDFGIASAWTPAEKTLSVCNIGGCPLSVASAAVGCADFTLIANPFPAAVPPGSCLDLVVRFTPVLPGKKSCGLTITSNDPDTPAVNRTLTARTPPAFSLHGGMVNPHGALHSVAKQGSTFHLDFVYPWTPNWAWDVRLGYSRFDGRAANPDIDLATLSTNAKFTLNPAAPVHVFFNGGFGLYHFDPGTFEGGGNLGVGLNVPLNPIFALELTYNYDWAFTASPSLDFSQVQLGLLVSF